MSVKDLLSISHRMHQVLKCKLDVGAWLRRIKKEGMLVQRMRTTWCVMLSHHI